LARTGCLGCPECKEARDRAKRRELYADPDLGRRLQLIRERVGDDYATIWELRSEGMTLEEIGEAVGLFDQLVSVRLRKIKRHLSEIGD
jgi:hypothetical protein